jgi:hypothetical protein
MWLVVMRSKNRKSPLVVFNGGAGAYNHGRRVPRGPYVHSSEAAASEWAQKLNKSFHKKHGFVYTAENCNTLKDARATGYEFAGESGYAFGEE